MKAFKICLLCLIGCVNLMASSIVVTSDIVDNTTWDADTIFIDKPDFTIQSGSRLTIAPGTVIKFVKVLRFITVRGAISAIGTADDSIRFSHENPAITWQGIRLTGRGHGTGMYDSSYLKFCSIANITSTETDSLYMKRGGALYCGAGNYVELGNSLFAKCKGYHGGAIYIDSGAVVRIDDCVFYSNTAGFLGGGAIKTCDNGSADLQVWNSLFKLNYARPAGAVRIGKGTKAEFNNCVFYRDTTQSINPKNGDLNGGAIAVTGPADVTLRGCIIFHCRSYGKGGGIYSADASIKLINCTISANSSVYGGGIYFAHDKAASSPQLINTIDGGNGTVPGIKMSRDSAGCGIFLDSAVTPAFQNCQLYDTVYDHTITQYMDNFTNTQYRLTNFVHRIKRDYYDTLITGYQLDRKDPAVNGGTPDTTGLGLPEFDLLGQKRIFGTAVDIGAIEYNDSLIKVFISKDSRKPSSIALSSPCKAVLYSLDGRKLAVFEGPRSPQSIRQFIATRYSRGIYLVELSRFGRDRWTEKVLVK